MSKKPRLGLIVAALAMLSILISACGSTTTSTPASTSTTTTASSPACVSGTIQASGSTALQPLAKDVAADYQKKCSGSNITISGGGSGTGQKNVSDGSVNIGNSDVFASSKYTGLVDHQVAVVVFSIVINSKVTGITNLTTAELKGIYTGTIKNWNQIAGGPNLQIVPVSRPSGSGTRATFEKFVIGTPEHLSGNPIANTSGDVANTVNQTDGAISYVQTSYAKQNSLTTVSIDGVSDADANVENNSYKFWNLEHMYTKGDATGLAKAFIDYMKAPETESFRTKDGFLNISQLSSSALAAKQPAA